MQGRRETPSFTPKEILEVEGEDRNRIQRILLLTGAMEDVEVMAATVVLLQVAPVVVERTEGTVETVVMEEQGMVVVMVVMAVMAVMEEIVVMEVMAEALGLVMVEMAEAEETLMDGPRPPF